MKNVIAAATLVISALVSAPAIAGEAYVGNSDTYTNSRSVTNINLRGQTNFKGEKLEFAGAIKIEEFDRDTSVSGGDRIVDVDSGDAGALSAFINYETYNGFSAYHGTSSTVENQRSYEWEVYGGVR